MQIYSCGLIHGGAALTRRALKNAREQDVGEVQEFEKPKRGVEGENGRYSSAISLLKRTIQERRKVQGMRWEDRWMDEAKPTSRSFSVCLRGYLQPAHSTHFYLGVLVQQTTVCVSFTLL